MSLNELVSHALDESDTPEFDAMRLVHYLMSRFGWSAGVLARAPDADRIPEMPMPPKNDPDPWCNHDAPGAAPGDRCECGAIVPDPPTRGRTA